MNRTNSELESLIQLFSNFYECIIINEPDKDNLQSQLHQFLSTFDPTDINFTKTQEFLKKSKGDFASASKPPNLTSKGHEFSKCLPSTLSVKKNHDFETFKNDEYLSYYSEIMNEMVSVEEKFPVQDSLPDLKAKSGFLLEFLSTLKKNNEEIYKLMLQKEEQKETVSKEEQEFNSLKKKTKSFIQRCVKCNREYVENEIKLNNNYLCNLCR